MWLVILGANLVLTRYPNRPHLDHLCGRIHREGSCAIVTKQPSPFSGPCLGVEACSGNPMWMVGRGCGFPSLVVDTHKFTPCLALHIEMRIPSLSPSRFIDPEAGQRLLALGGCEACFFPENQHQHSWNRGHRSHVLVNSPLTRNGFPSFLSLLPLLLLI